jgi:hypothetical protein
MSHQDAEKRVKKLSLEDKAQIVSWREEGVPVAIIAECLGHYWSSIKRLLVKAKSLPPRSISARKKASGRPSVISKHALKILERYVKKNPAATAGNIKDNVPEVAAVLLQHIRRLLVEKLRMRSRIAAHKPLLTRQMKAKRLAFAKKYRHWTEEVWSRVMYSNESTFRCLLEVRRPAGSDRFDSRYTMKTVKHPASLMAWASFTGACGCAGIFFPPPNVTMNRER